MPYVLKEKAIAPILKDCDVRRGMSSPERPYFVSKAYTEYFLPYPRETILYKIKPLTANTRIV
jgi:hypothetical protein